MNSWTEGTKKQYSPHIVRWVTYCQHHCIDPFSASVNDGAEFLVDYFTTAAVEDSVMNTARSALSAIIGPTGSISFGKNPLLKGMFKERPSLPKYTVTYDVNTVFTYIKTLPDVISMTLEDLNKTTATMLCLLSGQRSQTLGAISINHMFLDNNTVVFYISTLLKQSRPTYHQQPIKFVRYHVDQALCPVKFISTYLTKTKEYRCKESTKNFISYATPFKSVSSTTITRWVTNVLSRSGIETTTFTAHSTRSASTSKAKRNLSLTEIAKAAGWSNNRTMAKFYNKPIISNFGSAVLDNSNNM